MTQRIISYAALLLFCFGGPAAAQDVAFDGMLGGRNFGDGTGMFVAELRVGIAPSTWLVRPTVGIAGATDIYGSQRELMLGAHGDIQAASFLAFTLGGGVSRVSQDGGEWNSGSSTGGYLQAALLARRSPSARVMLAAEVRHLAAPSFTRKDGLKEEVSFTQLTFGLTVRLKR